MSEIIIYKTPGKTTQVEVQFDKETVWLNRQQLSKLFDRDVKTIGKHINNVFSEGELDEKRTVAKFATVQKEGRRDVEREIEYYNLDVIISVSYRVNSKRGTQFRQWATQRLKDFLVKGYTVNQKRLDELQQTVQFIQKSAGNQVNLNETKGMLDIIAQYTQSFVLFNQYDSHAFKQEKLRMHVTYEIDYNRAKAVIGALKKQLQKKKEAGELKINDNALVTLALLVAQSNPVEKELMIQLITQLIQNS